MNTYPKSLLILLAFILLHCSDNNKPEQANTPISSPMEIKIDSIANDFIDQGKIMGLSIAVAQKDEVIYNKSFGFLDTGRTQKVNNDHTFLMASISKLITTTLAMKLVEEGRLSLDASLYDFLPDFPNQEQAKKIKLRQLLTHTAGLKDYADAVDSVYLATRISPTYDDYYAFFAENELDFEPDTHFNYSNSGFILMAMVIERITGKPFQEEIDRIINKPGGLDLKLIAERINTPEMCPYFELVDTILEPRPHWPWIKGDGGLTTTAKDLVTFPYKWANEVIISKQSYDAMVTPHKLIDGISTGYGLGVRTGNFEGEKVIGHTGGNKSTMSIMAYFPEREISLVVFVNTDNTPTDALYIEGFVALAALGKEIPVLSEMEIKDENLDRFLGDYKSIDNFYYGKGNITILKYPDDSHLYRKRTGSESKGTKLFYLGNNTFGYESFPMDRVIFETNNNGEIVAYNNYWNGLRKGSFFRKVD